MQLQSYRSNSCESAGILPSRLRMQKLANIKKATVKKPNLPNSISGGGSIETPQSENWTAKKYSGDTATNINKFKRAIRSGSTKTARTILETKSFKNKLTESDYGRLAGRSAAPVAWCGSAWPTVLC